LRHPRRDRPGTGAFLDSGTAARELCASF
jgi:hypothetical protein